MSANNVLRVLNANRKRGGWDGFKELTKQVDVGSYPVLKGIWYDREN